MPRFAKRELEQPTHLGERLQVARTQRYLTLPQVAKKLGLPRAYLQALEEGDWEALPKGDYGRYFLKQYAAFLQLPPAELLEQYPGPTGPALVQSAPHPAQVRVLVAVHPARRLLYVAAAAAVLLYLVLAAGRTVLPPRLTLSFPPVDLTTSQPEVPVRGVTKPGTSVTINGSAVDVGEDGSFNSPVPLQVGLNTLTITATRPYRKPVTVLRRVRFLPAPGLDAPSLIP